MGCRDLVAARGMHVLPRSRAVKHDTSSHPFTPHSKAFVRTAGLLPVPQPDGSTAHRNRPLERVAGHTAPSPRLTQRPISLIKACEQEGGGGGWRHHVATRARRSTDACPPHDPNPPPLQVAFPLHPSVRLRARTVGTARPPARLPARRPPAWVACFRPGLRRKKDQWSLLRLLERRFGGHHGGAPRRRAALQ